MSSSIVFVKEKPVTNQWYLKFSNNVIVWETTLLKCDFHLVCVHIDFITMLNPDKKELDNAVGWQLLNQFMICFVSMCTMTGISAKSPTFSLIWMLLGLVISWDHL